MEKSDEPSDTLNLTWVMKKNDVTGQAESHSKIPRVTLVSVKKEPLSFTNRNNKRTEYFLARVRLPNGELISVIIWKQNFIGHNMQVGREYTCNLRAYIDNLGARKIVATLAPFIEGADDSINSVSQAEPITEALGEPQDENALERNSQSTPSFEDQSEVNLMERVKVLRERGEISLAAEVVAQALNNEPGNIWNKRAAAWVYYDYLKKYSHPDSFNVFKENLVKIKDLQLPEDEKIVFDNSAWQVARMVFGIHRQKQVDYGKINELFNIIKEFHFTKPSKAYSVIYKAFHKGYQNWSQYLTFADWWSFENFRPEDYLKEEFKDKKIMSIAEQAYIAYSKKLLEGEPVDPLGQERATDKNKISTFLPRLDKIIDERPEYQYPPYFKAKLLLVLGDDENTLSSFLPFAKQKRNDFWVWEVMAEIFPDDRETQFACYCKALSLKTPEDFLVKLRQTFAGMLVKRQLYDEAKTEIKQVIATREKYEWKLPNQVTQWTERDWYKGATPKKDNKDLYSQHVKKAEEILFHDIPEEIIVVEFVNENKNMLNFVKDKQKFGFFNYSGHLDKPKIGDVLRVRFNGEGRDGFYNILSAKKTESDLPTETIRSFEGKLKVIAPLNFGFVDDVYIEPKFIQDNQLVGGKTMTGKAILSFNKKKNEWGWKAIELE